ncbi:MAG: hypothetical protein ACFCVK_17250 [Acidimicrobiales bacterium]
MLRDPQTPEAPTDPPPRHELDRHPLAADQGVADAAADHAETDPAVLDEHEVGLLLQPELGEGVRPPLDGDLPLADGLGGVGAQVADEVVVVPPGLTNGERAGERRLGVGKPRLDHVDGGEPGVEPRLDLPPVAAQGQEPVEHLVGPAGGARPGPELGRRRRWP